MNTWTDIADHIADRFVIAASHGDTIALHWRFPTTDGGEIVQRQRVQPVADDKTPYVAVVCEVASSHQLTPSEAMKLNMKLGVGALGLLGDTVVLRAYLDMAAVDHRQLDRIIEATAREAARVRAHALGAAPMEAVITAVSHWM